MKQTLEGVSMEIPTKCEDHTCAKCSLREYGRSSACVECLAYEVQRLRDEREKNPGVWDKAPDNAGFCSVSYGIESGVPCLPQKAYFYNREPPKTIEQEIIEEISRKHYSPALDIEKMLAEALAEYKERTK